MKRILLLLLFALGISWAQAAYLRNVPVTVTQPDGTKLECFASGDEFYNYLHDAEGFTIIQDQHSGFYVYADLKNDELVSTTLIAGKDNPAGKLTPNLNISSEKRMQMRKAWEIPERYRVEQTRTGEANHGKLNNISIFIRFSDDLEFTNTYSSINNMFNDSTASAVSMYNYFKEASYGQVYVPTTFYPGHSGETIISYQDTQARGFFQPYNAVTNTSGYQTDAERATREFDLLERAVNYVNTNNPVPTSLNIDYDSNGYVDNVCFIVKGNVGDWNTLLWPHKWNLYDRTVSINGKVVNVFNFQLADAAGYFNTSTMCHEMNHSFGAPDLYHYSYDGLTPVGLWDLMEINSTPPQHMGAYMKYKYGNWIDEIPEIKATGTYTLNDLSSSTNNCYKIASGVSGQYYVLEYRKQSVEAALPGSGLLIYRINTAFTGNANYDPSKGQYDEVYIYRPSEHDNVNSAYFSVEAGRTAFHSGTDPQPFYTDGSVNNDLMITNITSAGSTISFIYTARLYVTPENLSIHPTGGSLAVTLGAGPQANSWTASSNQSWLTVSPTSGNGNSSTHTITLSATANTTNNSRTAVVTFTQAGNTATVTVSQDVVAQGNFSYDFEACTDFAVDDFPPCTTYDGDGSSTIVFSGFDYPNKFYTGSFIAYNESQASGSYGFEAHQGSKIGACFRSNGVQNNDWLITPMISLKSNSQLSFYAKSFLNQNGLERFRVLVSTTGNTPSDFTLISSGEYVEAPTSWTQYTYDLSAYNNQNIYIAIQCVSNGTLAFLIDDISVTSEETYTVTLSANGTTSTIEVPQGSSTTLPAGAAPDGYTFVGWSASAVSVTNTVPEVVAAQYTASANVTLYAVYAIGGVNYSTNITALSGTLATQIYNTNCYISGTATIPSGVTVTCNYGLGNTTASNLIVKDGGQLIINNSGVMATVEKEIDAWTTTNNNGWYTISSPVIAQSIESMFGNPQSGTITVDLYSYDEPSYTWLNYHNGSIAETSLAPGKGYLTANGAATTRQFIGELNNSSITANLSYASTYEPLKGFNFVGNPYTHNITINNNATVSELVATGYYKLNNGAFVASANEVAIAPKEGFFVMATAADQTITFNNATSGSKERGTDDQYISIEVSNSTHMDRAYVMFDNAIGLAKVSHMDETAPMLYIPQEGKNYAIVVMTTAKENLQELPVCFSAGEMGSYTLCIKPQNLEFTYLHLIDNLTGADIDLLTQNSYTFVAGANDYASRFKLVFNPIENESSVGENFAFVNNGNLIINGIEDGATLQFIDVQGRIVSSEIVSGSYSKALNVKSGVYVVRLIEGSKVRIQKLVVE